MICVDLDCTLIDSERRYGDERVIAADYGISEEEYIVAVDELYRRHGALAFSFELCFSILSERRPGLSKDVVNALNTLLDRNYFFPDSDFFLSSFSPQEVTIITSGPHDFQWRKIAAHNLGSRTNCIWITKHKARAVGAMVVYKNPDEKMFFIDDAPREIEAVKKAFPEVICIQVREPASWETQRETEYYDVHLPNLEAVTHYIKGTLAASK